MYKHATGADPYRLPTRWLGASPQPQNAAAPAGRPALAATTALNFVSTNDIIGGNSGSPVVDVTGALVGLIFDGNLESLPNRFIYDETRARAISVDTASMLEALRTVYHADALAQELVSP
jgi:hypothetical protein